MISKQALDAAVDAYYKAKLSQVLTEIESIPYDGTELPDIVRNIKKEGDTARAIVLTSLIEDRLKSLMSYNMHDLDSNKSQERLFNGSGSLSTFSNRILICYHLGWISKKSFICINQIRKIRNEFAHNAYKVNFNTSYMSKFLPILFEVLDSFENSIYPILINEKENKHLICPSKLNISDKFLCASIICIGNLFNELITYPISSKNQVNPKDFQDLLGFSPKNTTKIIRNMLMATTIVLTE